MATEFSVGQVVRHPRFGIGRVRAAAPGGYIVFFPQLADNEEKHLVPGSLTEADDREWELVDQFGARDDRDRGDTGPTATALRLRASDWSDEELVVLIAAYLNNDFAAGDDEHEENHRIAAALRRSPAAVDRQWRNVADLDKGKAALHVGENVRGALERYLRDPDASRESARQVARRNGWRIEDLL